MWEKFHFDSARGNIKLKGQQLSTSHKVSRWQFWTRKGNELGDVTALSIRLIHPSLFTLTPSHQGPSILIHHSYCSIINNSNSLSKGKIKYIWLGCCFRFHSSMVYLKQFQPHPFKLRASSSMYIII